jgi:hypothetical protein
VVCVVETFAWAERSFVRVWFISSGSGLIGFGCISELESRIEHLRDLKRRYLQILGLSRAFTSHFYHVIQTQVRKSEI